MLSSEVDKAVALLAAADDLLEHADLSSGELHARLAVMEQLESFRRKTLAHSYTLAASIAADGQRRVPHETPKTMIANVLRIHPRAAARRLNEADLLQKRTSLTGEPLSPHLPTTAEVFRSGLLDDEHIKVIVGFFDTQIPVGTPAELRDECEEFLARKATELRPDQLKKLANKLATMVNPDGNYTEKDQQQRRGATLGPQGPDGMSKLTIWLTPTARAALEAFYAKFAQRGSCLPDDPDPFNLGEEQAPVPAQRSEMERAISTDLRTVPQRQHDAFEALLLTFLGNPALGRHHGLPVSITATATLDQITRLAGHAVSTTGTLIPIPELIRLASHRGGYHYLAVFDDHKNRILHFGKARRCASGDQFLVLAAKERGCTKPGCDQPADRTQVHHVNEWAVHRRTDIEDLTLACFDDHPTVGPDGWTTTKGKDGHTYWTPPADYPRKKAATNDFHHPERYLSQFEKDGDDV